MSQYQYIFGMHAVGAVIDANAAIINALYVDRKRQDKRVRELVAQADRQGVKVIQCEREQLEQQAGGGSHQGIVAQCHIPKPLPESALASLVEQSDHSLLFLLLDGVQDPHNLGACLRTADAAGVDAIIIPKDRSVALTATVIKVASGAAFTVPVISVTNLSRTMRYLQDAGVWFVGTDGASSQTLYELDLTGSIALVMGAEGSGLRRLTKEVCDYLVSLPMQGSVQSLNVSVASGICLYEVLRQRIQSRGSKS